MKMLYILLIFPFSIVSIFSPTAKIYVAGHNGLVGSAIKRSLRRKGFNNIVTRTSSELDLRSQLDVDKFFEAERPEYVFLCAAKVGGILANINFPAEFIYDNLMLECNIIHSSYKYGVKKLLFLGSSCVYPRLCPQPMKEEFLLDGKPEPTNEFYALAKISGIKMCQAYNKQYGTNFISCMPTNIYGPFDHYDDMLKSHVVSALISKFHRAKINNIDSVTILGTGKARREFLYSDDLAEASIFLMEKYNGSEIVNIGTGEDVSIKELAFMVKEVVGYLGDVLFDESKPDGMPQKLLDVSKINFLGWKHRVDLIDGLNRSYSWYLDSIK